MKLYLNCIPLLIMFLFFQLMLNLSDLRAQPNKSIKSSPALQLWDDKPAKNWMTDAYPMGNGRIGGMVFGGLSREHIQFNEISLWTGDETETGAYQAFGDLFVEDRKSVV